MVVYLLRSAWSSKDLHCVDALRKANVISEIQQQCNKFDFRIVGTMSDGELKRFDIVTSPAPSHEFDDSIGV